MIDLFHTTTIMSTIILQSLHLHHRLKISFKQRTVAANQMKVSFKATAFNFPTLQCRWVLSLTHVKRKPFKSNYTTPKFTSSEGAPSNFVIQVKLIPPLRPFYWHSTCHVTFKGFRYLTEDSFFLLLFFFFSYCWYLFFLFCYCVSLHSPLLILKRENMFVNIT